MPATKEELVKKIACNCMVLPCVHNTEISDDIRIEVTYTGYVSKKGVTILLIPKDKFLIMEESPSTYAVRVID